MSFTPSIESLRRMYLLKYPADQREERGVEFDRMVQELQAATIRDAVAHFQQNVSLDDFIEHAGFENVNWDTIQNAWMQQQYYLQWFEHHANMIEEHYPENTVNAPAHEAKKESLKAVLQAHGYPASMVGHILHSIALWEGAS